MKPSRAGMILALGIISLVMCAPLGIVAWIMGNNDLKEMNQGLMDPSGRDLTNGGRICGIVGTVLFVAQIVVIISFLSIAGVGLFIGAQEAERAKSDIKIPEQVEGVR